MNNVLDAADRVFWWLRDHAVVAALLVLGLVALAAYAATSGGDDTEIPSDSVAVVGQSKITQERLAHWQKVFSASAAAGGTTGTTPENGRTAAFGLLAGAAWVEEEARQKDVSVSPEEVTKAVEASLQQAGASTPEDKATVLKQLGTSEADLRFQQRTTLLASKLQDKVAAEVQQPSATQIESVYQGEPGRWATPSKRDVEAVLSVDEKTARQARAALEGGASFAEVNRRFAANPGQVEDGGLIEGVTNGGAGEPADRAVFEAEQGVLTGPIDTGAGWLVFRVKKVAPLPKQSLEQATPAIRENLLSLARGKATADFLTQMQRRWRPETRCVPTFASSQFCAKAES